MVRSEGVLGLDCGSTVDDVIVAITSSFISYVLG